MCSSLDILKMLTCYYKLNLLLYLHDTLYFVILIENMETFTVLCEIRTNNLMF